MTPPDPQPQSPEQIAPTPETYAQAKLFLALLQAHGRGAIYAQDLEIGFRQWCHHVGELERRAVKAEHALTAANAATAAMLEELDRLKTELEQEKVRCGQLIQGKVVDDAKHSQVLAEISHRQARELAELGADRAAWQRRAQESEARVKELEGSRRFAEQLKSELEEVSKERDEYGEALRNICLLYGFDPSDGEGTSGNEVYEIVKADLSATAKKHEAEVAELRRDKERLDWLETKAQWNDFENRLKITFPVPTVPHCTIRAAIDAARNTASEPQQP